MLTGCWQGRDGNGFLSCWWWSIDLALYNSAVQGHKVLISSWWWPAHLWGDITRTTHKQAQLHTHTSWSTTYAIHHIPRNYRSTLHHQHDKKPVLSWPCQQPVNITHDYTNCPLYRVDPPDEQQACSKHVEAYHLNKLIENSASCWFILYGYCLKFHMLP